LEVETCHFPAGVPLAHAAGLLLDVEADLLALVAEHDLGFAELALGKSDIGMGLRRKDGYLDLNANVDVIAFELLVKLEVVIEFAQDAVLPDDVYCGPVASFLAFENVFAGGTLVFGFREALVVLDCHLFDVAFRLRGGQLLREGVIGRLDLERLAFGNTGKIAKLRLEIVAAVFELDDAVGNAGSAELRARDFDRELLIGGDAVADGLEDFFSAHLFSAQQLQRVADLRELEIRSEEHT